MHYFQLTFSTNPEIIGKSFPQVLKFDNGAHYDRESPNSVCKVYAWSAILENILTPTYKLEYFAKRTDLISTAVQNSILLVISQEFLSVLESCNLPIHNKFQIKLKHRNKHYEYYLFYIPPMPIHFKDIETGNVEFDFFRLEKPVTGYFLNENVKSVIENANITGVEFTPYEAAKSNFEKQL